MRIQCVNCQSVVNVAESLCGKAIRCPHCQTPTRVPGPQRRQTHLEGFSPAEPRAHVGGGVRRKTMLAPQYAEPIAQERYAPPPAPMRPRRRLLRRLRSSLRPARAKQRQYRHLGRRLSRASC